MNESIMDLTPAQIVKELDKHIVGQENAKKAVAIALRNRTRRRKLPKELRDEVAPKNIIMMGPTGIGKTEIARRLSRLCGAPFIKVEATKYTEVGYVGRDVESMVRDLMSVAVQLVKDELREGVQEEAERRTEEALLDLLLPGIRKSEPAAVGFSQPEIGENGDTREKFRKMLRAGQLEDRQVEVSITKSAFPAIEIFSGSNFEEMEMNLGNLSNLFGGKKKKKVTSVARAREIIMAEETDKLIDADRVSEVARERVEEMGIIFIDEIDKIAVKEGPLRRGRLPGGRAAGHPAHRGRKQGEHEARDGRHLAHPVHRGGCVSHEQAQRSDPGASGPLSDPRGAHGAHQRGFRADPDPAREQPDQAVRGAARDRRGNPGISVRTRSAGSARLPRK